MPTETFPLFSRTLYQPLTEPPGQQLIRKTVFPYQFVAVAVWPTVKKHRVTRTTLADGQRKFAHELPVNQAASVPISVGGLGLGDAHALLHDEWIT